MNPTHFPDTHPADLSPLSYGSGLALGLCLILGLPREAPSGAPIPAGDASNPTTVSTPAGTGFVRQAIDATKAARDRWSRLSASRP